MRINGMIGLAIVAAMTAGLFLPFLAWQGQSLSLAALAGGDDGPAYLLGLMLVLAGGAFACCLTDDVPGLFPIGLLYLVFPAYALQEAAEILGDEAAVATGGLPPLAGDPAAFGATVVFLAAYAAAALGAVDWWTGRARRRTHR